MPVGLAAMSVKRLTTLKTTVGTLWLALSFAATCGQTAWCAEVSLKGAGSTFASLLYKKWIEAYRNAAPAVSITYEAVGSGEGIARFTAATVDFAGSDVLMSDSETAKVHNGVIMVPTTAGMIALAYNLPGVKGELKLPRDVYADIFGGVIKRWDDTRIRDPNPGVTLPHLDIVLVARLDASGTTAVFTEHLAAIKPNWRQLGLGVGKIIQWPAGTMLASGSEALAARIKMSEGAIGYAEYGFPKRLGLPMATLQNKAGKFVAPNASSGQVALASPTPPPLRDLASSAVDPAAPGAYPIVTYSWIAINRRYTHAAKGTAIREFLDWGLSRGQNDGVDLGYVPLTTGVISLGKQALGAAGL
jgi:phosphate transport system substrate-binding protein